MQDRFKFRAVLHQNKYEEYRLEKFSHQRVFDVMSINLGIEYSTIEIIAEYPNGDWAVREIDDKDIDLIQCTGLKDHNNNLIYEGDIIVIPNQYPFYDYKNKEDMKQDLNSTEGEIKGESILNYIGIVEWIYSQWQYVYHCVNPKKRGISEGVNKGLNDFGFDETRNTCYEVIGNIYENTELLREGNNAR